MNHQNIVPPKEQSVGKSAILDFFDDTVQFVVQLPIPSMSIIFHLRVPNCLFPVN